MALNQISRDSAEGRVLLALRAGDIERHALEARLGANIGTSLHSLSKRGLIAKDNGTFTITEAGRAACPFRNQKLAGGTPGPVVPASQPKENTMPSRTHVFNAILSAGPAGITRKALSEKFGVSDNTIDNHLWHLCNADVPTVRRPQRGRLVASQFIDAAEGWVPEQETPAPLEKHSGTVFVDVSPAPAPAVQMTRATVPDLVHIEDAGLIEFAIFSTGGFEIHTENGTVRLGKGALDKLRRFLGMFAEAA